MRPSPLAISRRQRLFRPAALLDTLPWNSGSSYRWQRLPAEPPLDAAKTPQRQDGHDRRHLRALRLRPSLRLPLSCHPASGPERPLPVPGPTFATWALIGALAQIAATFLLVHLFSFRNFAVGTAYSRTEPAQAALLALVLFGETVGLGTVAAILVSILGVMLISVARTAFTPLSLVTSVVSRTALIGLTSGFFFASLRLHIALHRCRSPRAFRRPMPWSRPVTRSVWSSRSRRSPCFSG